MKRSLIIALLVIFVANFDLLYSQDKNSRKYFEVYRVIGKGKDLKESREDAFQNAIIEFLKKNVSPKDLKDNSEKILKEIFPSNKISQFIESYKVISSEESNEGVKIVVDVVVKVGKVIEVLQKIGVPLKEDILSKSDS